MTRRQMPEAMPADLAEVQSDRDDPGAMDAEELEQRVQEVQERLARELICDPQRLAQLDHDYEWSFETEPVLAEMFSLWTSPLNFTRLVDISARVQMLRAVAMRSARKAVRAQAERIVHNQYFPQEKDRA